MHDPTTIGQSSLQMCKSTACLLHEAPRLDVGKKMAQDKLHRCAEGRPRNRVTDPREVWH